MVSAPAAGRCRSRWVVAVLLAGAWQVRGKGDDDKKEAKKEEHKSKSSSNSAPDSGPALPGDPDYWTKLLGLGFSEGTLEPAFDPDTTDYKLTIKSGKASELLVTPTLNVGKYNLLKKPALIFNGKKMDYSPIVNIEFVQLLNTSIGPLDETITLEVADPNKKEGEWKMPWATELQSTTYKIHTIQAPDIEKIVTATEIAVADADTGERYYADPPYNPDSPRNEITYVVGEKVDKVSVTVSCPPEGTGLKYNGIRVGLGQSYTSHGFEGASKAVLAQCLYKNKRWTKDEEMQRTYVITIMRNAKLEGTNVSLRIWPPSKGVCHTHDIELEDGTPWKKFECMSRQPDCPLLGAYTNEKAEMDVYDHVKGAKYRLWNGIPTTVAVPEHKHDDVLLLQAGEHNRTYDMTFSLTPKCSTLKCPDRYTSNYSSVRDLRCNWKPCVLPRDFKVCCAKYKMPCAHAAFGLLKCPKGKVVQPANKCDWTPCVANDTATCCTPPSGHRASCSSMNCPQDSVHKPDSESMSCTNNPCAGPVDQKMCCAQRAICNTMECPDGYTKKYNAALYLCKEDRCGPTDRDTCCNPAAYCDSWTCPSEGWLPKPNNKIIPCGGDPCMEWDTGLCCNKKGFCSTATCPTGYYAKPGSEHIPCSGSANKVCDMSVDLHVCCLPAGQCANSYVCTRGFEPKLTARSISCPGATCTMSDRNLCCDMTDPFEAADMVNLVPAADEGKCTVQDSNFNWICEASVEKLNLRVNYTFDSPVGNEVFIGPMAVQGRSAVVAVPPLDVPKVGQKQFNFHMEGRVAGRGAVHSLLHIWINRGKAESKDGSKDEVKIDRRLEAPTAAAVHARAGALLALCMALALLVV